ncbi:unnamed protein product [Vitrella brassicaformis CCMP3155]|uniref:Pentapeptide repeat-containing protein n=2 Tax=Vitrella brassicaformis TaxID=1169539 RepID=A0A0G4GK23_VITBC|nr:unnamed protein product [Vitrella brassicaformis CCMP3155]|eukprot:CEM30288.1 unnamed protein product [Vitrella brassicaformis CCMP3155]
MASRGFCIAVAALLVGTTNAFRYSAVRPLSSPARHQHKTALRMADSSERGVERKLLSALPFLLGASVALSPVIDHTALTDSVAHASAATPEKGYRKPKILGTEYMGILRDKTEYPSWKAYDGKSSLDGKKLGSSGDKRLDWGGIKAENADFSYMWAPSNLFTDAKLKGSNFEGAFLEKSKWPGADLTNVDFTGTALNNADFTNAKNVDKIKSIAKADFSGATIDDSTLSKLCARPGASAAKISCSGGLTASSAPAPAPAAPAAE